MKTQSTSLRLAINWAIHNGSCMKITYRDYNGRITLRVVEPKSWVSSNKFTAYCHLRQDNRTFRIENVIRFEKNNEEPMIVEDFPQKEETSFTPAADIHSTTIALYVDQELEQLMSALKSLEDRLADEELRLATLEGEYNAFQKFQFLHPGRSFLKS